MGGIEVLIPTIIREFNDLSAIAYVVYDRAVDDKCVFYGTEVRVTKGGKGTLSSAYALYRFANANRDSIIHGYNIGPIFLIILKLAQVKKVIYSIHGTRYWRNWHQRLLRKLLWKIALSSRVKFISNSEYSRQRFREQISMQVNPTVLYNPIDTGRFLHYKSNFPRYPRKIIYVGRLAKGKNLLLWLEVAQKIAVNDSDVSFHLYGDGPLLHNLIERAEHLMLSDRVVFHGFERDIEEAYRSGDLMIFLSEYESFGNVIIESILSGTPVLCSNISASSEILSEFPQFLVDLDSQICEVILRKLDNYEQLAKITQAAQIKFADKYTIRNHTDKLRQIYDDV